MARIVNIQEFLNNTSFREVDSYHPITLIVEDDFIPQNQGAYRIQGDGQIVSVNENEIDTKNAVFCNIQQLTQMLLSYKRPIELERLSLIKGNHNTIGQLEKLIPEKQTYLPDFF
nr:sterol carrier protein domain-containing protein [Gracilibacillus oryzae]